MDGLFVHGWWSSLGVDIYFVCVLKDLSLCSSRKHGLLLVFCLFMRMDINH